MPRKPIQWRDNARNAVIYTRCSTEEQITDGHGIESQEAACRRECAQRGWGVVKVFTDPGVSGWDDVERPGFNALLAYLKANHDCNLVFYDYSRFGRNTTRALLAFEEQLDRLGVISVAVDAPGIDVRTAKGRAHRRVELSNAEEFSDSNSEKTQDRMRVALDAGRWLRQAPLGYRNVRRAPAGQPNIVPEPAEAQLIRRAFEMLASGQHEVNEVWRTVTDLGLRSTKGNQLRQDVFVKMMRNPVYAGKVPSRRHRRVVHGLHEPLVDADTFTNAQRVLKGKRPYAKHDRNNDDFPLCGLLRCDYCRHPPRAYWARGAGGKRYPYYDCCNPKCRRVKPRHTSRIEGQFLALLDRWQPYAYADLPEKLRARATDLEASRAEQINLIKTEIAATERRKKTLLDKWLDGQLPDPTYHAKDGELDVELADLTARQHRLESDSTAGCLDLVYGLHLDDVLSLPEMYIDADVKWQKQLGRILYPDGLMVSEAGIANAEADGNLFFDLDALHTWLDAHSMSDADLRTYFGADANANEVDEMAAMLKTEQVYRSVQCSKSDGFKAAENDSKSVQTFEHDKGIQFQALPTAESPKIGVGGGVARPEGFEPPAFWFVAP